MLILISKKCFYKLCDMPVFFHLMRLVYSCRWFQVWPKNLLLSYIAYTTLWFVIFQAFLTEEFLNTHPEQEHHVRTLRGCVAEQVIQSIHFIIILPSFCLCSLYPCIHPFWESMYIEMVYLVVTQWFMLANRQASSEAEQQLRSTVTQLRLWIQILFGSGSMFQILSCLLQ